VWFRARSAWPYREAPVHKLVLERNRVKRDLPVPKARARCRDGGETWSANLASATLPGHSITRIDSTEKLGADFLFVTVANFGHSHVFCSRDGGKTWEDVDKGRLPDVPHHAVVIRPDQPQTVYVGNDAGVFVSHDFGVTWENMTQNLPNVSIVDLVLQEKDGTLSAATYGRSLWRTRI